MKKIKTLASYALFGLLITSCSSDDDNNGGEETPSITQAEVIANHANIVYQSYLDSYNAALTMQTAINDFVDNPTQEGFDAAKEAWLAAREPYGQTEAYRETNSPVDVDESGSSPWGIGNEGQMNAWPIDESYIDYVAVGTESHAGDYASIISDANITIDEATLAQLNEEENDKSISTGWHAVEFLLWGQDNTSPSDDLPGQREFTDYTTADNADRRGEYLKVSTSLLINDLKDLVDTWNTGGAYRTIFEDLDEAVALKQLINGAFFIAGDELSAERMIAPVDSTDGIDNSGQEDEHSCFSDNTHRDIFANTAGVYNVVFGKYGDISGSSFYDLVKQEDEAQAAKLKEAADEAIAKVNIIANNAQPFDFLITQESSTDATFGPVMQAVVALQTWGDEISASASVIGINL
ncbi:imelysin family protein [Flagellimonas onchidii]|uniref:imelysin family protein n=1 Tax=Flagellimonas onchidii TaxID=2562684 RepID=UPI0010A6B2A2|nr:imelysin family protein [Allomuricauda onchidii]